VAVTPLRVPPTWEAFSTNRTPVPVWAADRSAKVPAVYELYSRQVADVPLTFETYTRTPLAPAGMAPKVTRGMSSPSTVTDAAALDQVSPNAP
jgi:hypothetical protein